MKITYLGTTMLLFDDGKDQILFDCHVTRPSLLRCLLGTLETDAIVADRVIQDYEIERLKGIFVSHSHHDHVMDAPYFAAKCNSHIYGSESVLNVARGSAIEEEMLHSFKEQREFRIGDFRIRILDSLHSTPHWYNNDIGKTIDKPLKKPVRKRDYKEGGSYDFLVSHSGKTYLIRPSCNFIPNQLDGISCDILLLGTGGLSNENKKWQAEFFSETVGKVKPETVIPIHWDNFFTPLYKGMKKMPCLAENTDLSLGAVEDCCTSNGIEFLLINPLSSVEI